MTTLEQAIHKIDFKKMKEDLLKQEIVIDNDYIESIEFDYCDSDCEYDIKGFSYCINIKYMPFHIYPMRSYNYVQTYKSVKRMLNRLYKQVKPDTQVKRTDNMVTLVDRTDHIFVSGRDYEYYTFYMKDSTEFTVNEKEFYALDKLYDGELACKVEN